MASLQLTTNTIVVLLLLSIIICYTTTFDRCAVVVVAFSTTKITTTRTKISTTKNVYCTSGGQRQQIQQQHQQRCYNSMLYVANAIPTDTVVGTTNDSNSNFVMSSSSSSSSSVNNNDSVVQDVSSSSTSSSSSTQTEFSSSSATVGTNGGAKTLYEILGARSDESREQLKRRYLSLAKQSHPDAVRQQQNNNNNKVQYEFSEIAAAWRILSDTKERRRYDRSLQAERISEDIANWAGVIFTKAATEWAMPFFQKQAATTTTTSNTSSKNNNKQQSKTSPSSSSSFSQQKQQQQSVQPKTPVPTSFSSKSNTLNTEAVTASTTTTTTIDSSSSSSTSSTSSTSSSVGQFEVPVRTPMDTSSYVHQHQEQNDNKFHSTDKETTNNFDNNNNIDIIPTKEQYILELEEKSDVLEQRAVSEYKLAVQLQYELQQLTRERLRLALGTAYSGISSSDAFKILHDIDTNIFSSSSSSSSIYDSKNGGDGKENTSSNNNNNKSNHHQHIPFSPVKSFWRAATQSTSEYVQDEIKTLENLEIMYIDVQQVDNVIQELYRDQIRQRAYAKDELDYLCEQEEIARQQYINAKNAVAEQKQLFQLLCNEVSYSEHQSQKSSYDIERKSISVQEQSEHVRIALLKRITNGIKQQQQQQQQQQIKNNQQQQQRQGNQEEQQQQQHLIDVDESTSSSILSNKHNSLFTSQNNIDNVDLQIYQNFLDNITNNNKQLQQSSSKENNNSNNNNNNNAYLLQELSSIRQQEQQLVEQISRYEIKAAKILSRANRIRQQSINETR